MIIIINDIYNDLGFTVGDRLICLVLFDEEQLRRVHDKTVYEQGLSQGISSIVKTYKKFNGLYQGALLNTIAHFI